MSLTTSESATHVRRLLQAAQHGGLPRLVLTLHRYLNGEVGLFDLDGSVLATAPDRALWDYEQVLQAREAPSRSDLLVRTVEFQHEAVALLAARTPVENAPLVEIAGEVVALEIGRLRAGQEVRRELASNVLDDVIENRVSELEARERMRRIGLDPGRRFRVLLGWSEGSGNRRASIPWAVYSLVSNRPDPFVRVPRGEDIVMVVPDDPMVDRIASTLLQHVAHLGRHARVGISPPHTGGKGLRAAYFEARTALRQGTGIQRPARVDLARLLVLTNETVPLDEIAGNFLRPLLSYDDDHSGALIETLRVYLDANRVAGDAAERLFVHRNTLRYRLRQIEELLGLSLDSSSVITNLCLALAALDAENGTATGEKS